MDSRFANLSDLFQRGVINRREFLRRAALLGASAGAVNLLAACTPAAPQPGPTPTTAGPAAQPTTPRVAPPPPAATPAPATDIKRGGEIVHAWNWTVPTMDPHLSSLPQHMIYENAYDGLVRFELVNPDTGEHKVSGVLAESWEQKDARTIVFKLRQGVKFHDGSAFDADVAAWNVLRARDHEKSQIKANLATIDTVTALDKSTLEIKTKADNAALLRVLAFTNGGLVRMISKAAFDKNGEEWLQRNPVGTGAFKFNQWISDDRVILDKNPDYFLKGEDGKALPYIDRVVMRYLPDPTVALQDMRAGSVHLLEWVQPKDVAIIRDDPNLDLVELPWNGNIYFKVGYNTESSPFNDVRVRQAANYGIDRVGMHQALGFGVGEPWDYPYWTQATMGYDPNLMKYTYDPAKVKQLLTDAGYPNGVEVELKVIAREPENTIGEFVQQMWSAVGIKTRLVAQERLSWIDAVRAKNFQACFWRGALWANIDPEMARPLVTCKAPINWAQWCDPEVDALMDKGLSELDPRKRTEIYREVWKIIQERAYGGTGFTNPLVEAYNKRVQGLAFNFSTFRMHDIWLK